MASQRHKTIVQGVAADGKQYAQGAARKDYWGTNPQSPGYSYPPAKSGRVKSISNIAISKVFLDGAAEYAKFTAGDQVTFLGVEGSGGGTFMGAPTTYTLGTANGSEMSFVLRNAANSANIDLSGLAAPLGRGHMRKP